MPRRVNSQKKRNKLDELLRLLLIQLASDLDVSQPPTKVHQLAPCIVPIELLEPNVSWGCGDRFRSATFWCDWALIQSLDWLTRLFFQPIRQTAISEYNTRSIWIKKKIIISISISKKYEIGEEIHGIGNRLVTQISENPYQLFLYLYISFHAMLQSRG